MRPSHCHTTRRLLAAALAATLGCAVEETGSVSLRVYAAAGPNPLADVVSLRLGLVDGDSITLPANTAFDLEAIGLDGASGVHQVSLEGLTSDGVVLARGVSQPETFDGKGLTVVDIVLRRAEAFSAGLSTVETGTAAPAVTPGQAPGDPTLVVGPGGVVMVDPWLVAPVATLTETTLAGLVSYLATQPHAVPVEPGKSWVLLSPAGCVSLALIDGWLAQGQPPTCVGAETLVPEASWLRVDAGAGAETRWLVVGGREGQGASAACRIVDTAPGRVEVHSCPDLAAPRERPLVAVAGERVVVVGGTSLSGSASANPYWGELRYLSALDTGVEALLQGPARAPSDGASYGGDSAVFAGDGTGALYAVVGGQLGTTGTLGRTRAGSTLAVLPDGRLLVAGGRTEDSAVSADLLALNSAGEFEFEAEVSLLVPRSDAQLYLLASGPVLVGGVAYGGIDPVSVLEVFVPH